MPIKIKDIKPQIFNNKTKGLFLVNQHEVCLAVTVPQKDEMQGVLSFDAEDINGISTRFGPGNAFEGDFILTFPSAEIEISSLDNLVPLSKGDPVFGDLIIYDDQCFYIKAQVLRSRPVFIDTCHLTAMHENQDFRHKGFYTSHWRYVVYSIDGEPEIIYDNTKSQSFKVRAPKQ